jgi:hypothetical protein
MLGILVRLRFLTWHLILSNTHNYDFKIVESIRIERCKGLCPLCGELEHSEHIILDCTKAVGWIINF